MSRGARWLPALGAAWLGFVAIRAASSPRVASGLVERVAMLGRTPSDWAVARFWGARGVRCDTARGGRQVARDGCGPAALQAVLGDRGAPTTQNLLWSLCRLPGGGTTLGRLATIARRFGQPCTVRGFVDVTRAPTPAIVHLRRGHFVVLHAVRRDVATLFDPACGCVRVPARVLRGAASGAVLVFEPAATTAALHQEAEP